MRNFLLLLISFLFLLPTVSFAQAGSGNLKFNRVVNLHHVYYIGWNCVLPNPNFPWFTNSDVRVNDTVPAGKVWKIEFISWENPAWNPSLSINSPNGLTGSSISLVGTNSYFSGPIWVGENHILITTEQTWNDPRSCRIARRFYSILEFDVVQ